MGGSHTSERGREKSRREDSKSSRAHASDAKIMRPDGLDRDSIENGGGVGVVTSMSLYRVIYHCSYIERILNRLYRKATKKDEDMQKQPDVSHVD